MRGPTRAASRPSTMITTRISISVKPRAASPTRRICLRSYAVGRPRQLPATCPGADGCGASLGSRAFRGVRRVSGFTLLEVLVAIVLTSIVALLAYAAAQVSFDARARLGAELSGLQGGRALREFLQDALRNAQSPQRPGDPGFTLQAGRLSFVTAGGGTPFDPGYDWLVTLGPSASGLEVVAVPLRPAPPLTAGLAPPPLTPGGGRGLAPGGSQWREGWGSGRGMAGAGAIRRWP